MKRVLVTGGRKYRRRDVVASTLLMIRGRDGIEVVIHGDATGADRLARDWARFGATSKVDDRPYPAKWTDLSHPDAVIKERRDGTKYDALAGFRRNQQMIDEGKPDLVVAFPGGGGTADMVRRAIKAGIPILEIKE